MAGRDFSEERLISSMFHGVWQSRYLSVLVPELLGNSCSPVSIQEIPERTGCRTDEKIYKLMRIIQGFTVADVILVVWQTRQNLQ